MVMHSQRVLPACLAVSLELARRMVSLIVQADCLRRDESHSGSCCVSMAAADRHAQVSIAKGNPLASVPVGFSWAVSYRVGMHHEQGASPWWPMCHASQLSGALELWDMWHAGRILQL